MTTRIQKAELFLRGVEGELLLDWLTQAYADGVVAFDADPDAVFGVLSTDLQLRPRGTKAERRKYNRVYYHFTKQFGTLRKGDVSAAQRKAASRTTHRTPAGFVAKLATIAGYTRSVRATKNALIVTYRVKK